jgi:hypothetical protein
MDYRIRVGKTKKNNRSPRVQFQILARKDQTLPCTVIIMIARYKPTSTHGFRPTRGRFLVLLVTDPASILDRKERAADQRHEVKLCGAKSNCTMIVEVAELHHASTNDLMSVLLELGLRSSAQAKGTRTVSHFASRSRTQRRSSSINANRGAASAAPYGVL